MGEGVPNMGEFRNSDDFSGKALSHFEVLGVLERGTAGSVYLARDTRLDRKVRLRHIPNHAFPDGQTKERFIRDTRSASALEHPNIGTIHETDTMPDGQVLVAMAHYPGETLSEKMGRGPLSLQKILDYAVQLASAVDEAHRNGVLHRDINPSNIIVGNDGILRLVDFGLAQLSANRSSISTMSPEQVRGDPVDERSDIWSLGRVLFEMLSGRIEGRLKDVITRCLATYPIKRYQKVGDVLQDLRRLRDRQQKRRLTILLGWNMAVVSGVIISVLLGYFLITRDPEPSSRFAIVDDPFGLGQGKVLMLHPGKVDTSINRLIADLELPEAAHIHAVDGPHRPATLYLKVGRPDIYGEPGEVNATWGLAAEGERRHSEIFTHSEHSVLARYAVSGDMEYRDGDHYKFMYPFTFDTDTYYEIWFVIDHARNTFDYYIRGGSQFPTVTRLAAGAQYRQKTRNSLDHLLLITVTDSLNIAPGGGDPVYFDDFYVYPDGVILDSPDDGWILVDDFESGDIGNWKVYRTSTGPMPKRTRLPADYF